MRWRITAITIAIIVALIASALLLWFFYFSPQRLKHPEEHIKVGILHSLTGVMGVSEKPVVDVALLAIDEINESGGLLGKKIVPVIADGQSDPLIFAQEAEKLILKEGVAAIFGTLTSSSRKMVKPVVEKHNVLLFYPAQYEGFESSNNIVYLGSTANQQAIPAVTWSINNLGKRLFLVGSDYIFPRAVNELIKDLVFARNGYVVGEEYIPLDTENFDSIIYKIIKIRPNVIINNITGSQNRPFFEALRKAGISPEKIPTMSLMVTETELSAFNIDEMVGDYGAQSYFQSINSPTNNIFVEKFKKKYGAHQVLSYRMQNAYVAFQFWQEAVTRAQTTNTDAVREQLGQIALNAPEGIISIDKATLHTWKPVLIGKIFPSKQFGIVWNSVSTIEPIPYPPLRSKEYWEHMLERMYKDYGNKWEK